jgi:hypothetical protein
VVHERIAAQSQLGPNKSDRAAEEEYLGHGSPHSRTYDFFAGLDHHGYGSLEAAAGENPRGLSCNAVRMLMEHTYQFRFDRHFHIRPCQSSCGKCILARTDRCCFQCNGTAQKDHVRQPLDNPEIIVAAVF